jgi:NTE family protein
MRKKLALVLGSGSSRGWAHIGAIEALLEERIPIDSIAGCSVGAYVGAI